MNTQYNQYVLAYFMLSELRNSAGKAHRESRGLGQRMAAGLGGLLIAVGERLQDPGPARPVANPQQHLA